MLFFSLFIYLFIYFFWLHVKIQIKNKTLVVESSLARNNGAASLEVPLVPFCSSGLIPLV